MEDSLKNVIFMEGGYEKAIYIGENCLKKGAWTVCRFNEGTWWKRGVLIAKSHYDMIICSNIRIK